MIDPYHFLVGILVSALGLLCIAKPRGVGRYRNRHAADPEPDRFQVITTRYITGPMFIVMGLIVIIV